VREGGSGTEGGRWGASQKEEARNGIGVKSNLDSFWNMLVYLLRTLWKKFIWNSMVSVSLKMHSDRAGYSSYQHATFLSVARVKMKEEHCSCRSWGFDVLTLIWKILRLKREGCQKHLLCYPQLPWSKSSIGNPGSLLMWEKQLQYTHPSCILNAPARFNLSTSPAIEAYLRLLSCHPLKICRLRISI
jgi:hypothetical protein